MSPDLKERKFDIPTRQMVEDPLDQIPMGPNPEDTAGYRPNSDNLEMLQNPAVAERRG